MTCALLIGEDHRLEHVDHLGDVGHLYTIGVFVEHVQREGCHESIAKGVLLIEVTGNGARLLIPPGAPLINEQTYLAFWISLIHDGLMLLDDLFDLKAFAECPVILIVVEVDC